MWDLLSKMFLHINTQNHLRKLLVVEYQTASEFICSFHISSLFVVPPEPEVSIRVSLKSGKCSKLLTASPDCTSPRCFSFHFEGGKIMSPCVIYNERESKSRTESTNKTEMRTGWDRDIDEKQEGTVQDEKTRQRHWLCLDSLLSHGGEDVCSHAPVVRLKNPGLLHSLQQSNSTHGCLAGKELVIPPHPFICLLVFFPHPFFPHHKHLHSVCFNKPPCFLATM